ncbi:hypothetical protein ROA7450_02640 [Roseovarius albus]|uniref:Alpha-L-glutamate ligase-related protein ATP-grasp domain-containing protein n=1 Tax=Roseovarius albus TaxID=1247867 RepID=A0A1X6ZIY0_9RHOB|nr:sugar-transfer associated ATP-grasp domain-containing protein [Roseovarius albus]SLN52505.1 hypothetical protein ROA7450_02640 [Roseovarius albus]
MDSIKDALKYQQIRDAGFDDKEITFFDLMGKPEDEICSYLPSFFYHSNILHTVNGAQREILCDKIATHHFLNAIDVATPTMVGVWHPIFGVTGDGRPMTTVAQFTSELENLLSGRAQLDLIFKPRDGGGGNDIFAATFVKTSGGKVAALIDNQPQSMDQFFAGLPKEPYSIAGKPSQGWVVQVKVEQHPDMGRFNESSLNTLRIGTYITKPQNGTGNAPEVLLDYACLRVGRAGANSDNWSTGGVMIRIDLETGRLGRGRFAPEYGGAFLEEHPDNNLHFSGLVLPYWDEAKQLCLRLAKALPSVRSVGWDVAITKEGPLIIEGNCPWGIFNPQANDVGYFTPERRARYAASGDPMPARQLPKKRALPGQSKRSWTMYKLRNKLGL